MDDCVATPDIAVVLPVYNGERYLAECIESVLQQTHGNFEFIIGDDRSCDLSVEIINRYRDDRIRFTGHVQNRGLFANLNWLISQARAPYIHFLCQDDRLEPDCLREEIAFLDHHPEIGMTYCKARFIDGTGAIYGETSLHDLPSVLTSELSLQYFFYLGCLPGNLSTVCARRISLVSSGLFDTTYVVAGDYDMWVRVCRHVGLGIVHKHLVHLRIHSGQLSRARSSSIPYYAEVRGIRQELLKDLPHGIRSYAKVYTQRKWDVHCFHFAVRCLLDGNVRDMINALRILGLGAVSVASVYWLLTGNNRWYTPPLIIENVRCCRSSSLAESTLEEAYDQDD